MCDEAVNDCLASLFINLLQFFYKFISDWFVTKEILEKDDNVLHANDEILFYNEDFDNITFTANQKHILAVDVYKINLDNDKNFDEDDLDTIIHVRRLGWSSKFEKQKALKKRSMKS